MIIGFYGSPGAGKTLNAVRWAVGYIKKGYYVFSNFPLLYATIISYPAFLKFDFPERSLVIIDEAGSWFNSRNWKKLTSIAFMKFTQSRKYKWDIIWTSQRPEAVDVQLRDITHEFVLCENYKIFYLLKHHDKPYFSQAPNRKYNLGIDFIPAFLLSPYYRWYDTTALVHPDWDFPPMDYIDYYAYYVQYLKPKAVEFRSLDGKVVKPKRPVELVSDIKRYYSEKRMKRLRTFFSKFARFRFNLKKVKPTSRRQGAEA